MDTTIKQQKLSAGGTPLYPSQTLRELLMDLCNKHGQGKLADQVGIDPAAFSRFRNGEGNISLKDLEAVLSFANVVIIPDEIMKNLFISLCTGYDLLKKSAQKKGW